MSKKIYQLAVLVILFSFGINAKAQVSVTGLTLASAYVQNFNTLSATASASWTNNSTLANWYASRSVGTLTTLTASNGNSTTAGLYNFGSTGTTDRALGSIGSSSTGDYHWGVRMKNNSGVTITAFQVTFTGEQWRNSRSGAQALNLSYRTSTSAITSVASTSGTWVSVAALDFTSPTINDVAQAIDGNATANRKTVTYTITGISLAPGSEIMFRWTDINHKSNDHGLAIDDLTITALNPNQFYSKSTGDLNNLSTWGNQLDGSGTAPATFTAQGQIFNIRNGATKTISANWTISGFGSKAILDNTGTTINFTIPAVYSMSGIIDLMDRAILTVNSPSAPQLGAITTTSTVNYANGNQNIAGANYGSLTVSGGGEKTLAAPVSVRGNLTLTSGIVSLKTFDLTMTTGTLISGASATNFIRTIGRGSLVRSVAKGTTVVFPVGSENLYNPLTISLTNSSTDDNFYVSVMPKLYGAYDEDFLPTAAEISSKVVNKSWIIEEETAGNSNATVMLQWSAADELTGFNRSLSNVANYQNDSWNTTTLGAATGTNPYTRSISGTSAFGVFGVTGQSASLSNSPLPVELVSFRALAAGNNVALTWQTATELNSDKFEVERSHNGLNWSRIGEVKSAGNSSVLVNYTYSDNLVPQSVSRIYYRLKQIDFDGTFAYSHVSVVSLNRTLQGQIILKTNPVAGNLQLNLNGIDVKDAVIEIYNPNGKKVFAADLAAYNAASGIELHNFPAGVYIYKIANQQQQLGAGRLVKVN